MTHPDGATTTFGYDKVGNRQSVTRQTSTGTVFSTTGYTYAPLNRLTDIVNKNGSSAIVSSYHYQLRADGKQSSVTDASGNRVSASSAGTTNSYTMDSSLPYTSVVEEYSNGTLAARYDYGDNLVRMDQGSGAYYYLYDSLGSTRTKFVIYGGFLCYSLSQRLQALLPAPTDSK